MKEYIIEAITAVTVVTAFALFIVLMVNRSGAERACLDGQIYERSSDYWIGLDIRCIPIST
jgi:hypothetical protein